jgi:hypothetical protein
VSGPTTTTTYKKRRVELGLESRGKSTKDMVGGSLRRWDRRIMDDLKF